MIDFIKKEYKNVFRASWAISILFEEYYGLQITEDEIGYIVLYIQAAIESKKHQYRTVMVSNFNMGHTQLVKEKIKKSVQEIEMCIRDSPPGAQHKCTEKRAIPGSTAFVPSVAGLIIAGEVVKDLCKA